MTKIYYKIFKKRHTKRSRSISPYNYVLYADPLSPFSFPELIIKTLVELGISYKISNKSKTDFLLREGDVNMIKLLCECVSEISIFERLDPDMVILKITEFVD